MSVNEGRGTVNVLEEMLRLLRSGGLRTTEDVAQRLGVSEPLVAAMTDNLSRRGYLVALEGGCAGGCGGCSMASACSVGAARAPVSPARMLALTDKGRRAAERV